jgi:hypothetical protein
MRGPGAECQRLRRTVRGLHPREVSRGAGDRDHLVVDRREFLDTVTLSLLAAPLAGEAQSGKVYRVGVPIVFQSEDIVIDAQRRPRRTLGCWTCGPEVAPMRFRATDLRPHGWPPPQTLRIPGPRWPERSRRGERHEGGGLPVTMAGPQRRPRRRMPRPREG